MQTIGGSGARYISVLVLLAACGGGSGGGQSAGASGGASPTRAGSGTGRAEAGTGGDGAGSSSTGRDDCGRQAPAVDTLELLLVMDDSGSMLPHQDALREQIPRMLEVLTSGDLEGDGKADFPKVRNFHLGVVSSDMGLVGISDIEKCAGLGKDGILQNTVGSTLSPPPDSALPACGVGPYPTFVSYTPGVEVAETVARDFSCVARRGNGGCSFEQQLEAMLKALWPSMDLDPKTGQPIVPERVQFLGQSDGSGTLGHGDRENAGFLRLDPREGRSLLAVLMVTDEEDCSSSNTAHFTPSSYLQPSDPLFGQPLNLRCFKNKQNLYPISRYVNGLAALRPGAEHLVVFGAIAGVPAELVDAAARDAVDFEDTASREQHYQRILDAEAMQEREDPTLMMGLGNLTPSCLLRTDSAGIVERKAWPPRRIVEVARGMGRQGMIGSLCQQDLRDPVDAFLQTIARTLDGATDPGIPGVCDPFLPGAPAPPQAGSGSSPRPNGPRCGGVSEACFEQSSQLECSEVEGCFWSSVSDSCTGSTRFCIDYADQLSCTRQPGCAWR